MLPRLFACLAAIIVAAACGGARAADVHDATLTIRDHRFVPAELRVPAGQKVRLTIVNDDASAEEFESYELNREKIVAGNGRIVVFIGPLRTGKYPFFGEFHMDTAKGVVIAE